LRLNFNGLKKHVSQVAQKQRDGEKRTPRGFVELRATDLVQGSDALGAVVEFSDEDGGRVTIRLASSDTLDVTGLVRTFWNRKR
jgi:hypothetical protein